MSDANQELIKRHKTVVQHLKDEGLDGLLVTDPYNIFYLLDFFFVPTERPFFCLIDKNSKISLVAPELEAEAGDLEIVDNIVTYFDYPGKENLTKWIFEKFQEMSTNLKYIGVDNISLSLYQEANQLLKEIKVDNKVNEMRLTKSEYEAERLRKAAIYADYIVSYGADIAREGISELELLDQMQSATLKKMVKELDEIIYVPGGPCGGLVPSGPRTALPHALPSNRILKKGEALILSCGANYRGYRVESERTFFLGEPGKEEREAFQVMKEAQSLGLSLMKPGYTCAEIDKQVLQFVKNSGYGDFLRHRTGHGKGLQEHEDPWVESGDTTVLEPGMVLSCEPGIYIEGLAGFRHSDTVIVREGEPEVLTEYSKNLEDLIL